MLATDGVLPLSPPIEVYRAATGSVLLERRYLWCVGLYLVTRTFYDCLVHWTGAGPAEHSRCDRDCLLAPQDGVLTHQDCLLAPQDCLLAHAEHCSSFKRGAAYQEYQRSTRCFWPFWLPWPVDHFQVAGWPEPKTLEERRVTPEAMAAFDQARMNDKQQQQQQQVQAATEAVHSSMARDQRHAAEATVQKVQQEKKKDA